MERSIRTIFRSFDGLETRERDAIFQGKKHFIKEKESGKCTGGWGFGGFCKYPLYRFARDVLVRFDPDGIRGQASQGLSLPGSRKWPMPASGVITSRRSITKGVTACML